MSSSARAGLQHPDATEVDPENWWKASGAAFADAGGLDGVASISIAAQQHGMVCLDEDGKVIRPALLWNDTRSAPEAEALVSELGADAWAHAVGSVPLAAFTVSKLRWLAEHEPENASRTRPSAFRTTGSPGGSWLPAPRRADDRVAHDRPKRRERDGLLVCPLPTITGSTCLSVPWGTWSSGPTCPQTGGEPRTVSALPGSGQALATMPRPRLVVGPMDGDVIVSVGTSGTAFASSDALMPDSSGTVAGFADATGRYLPLVCTLNAARVLDGVARSSASTSKVSPTSRYRLRWEPMGWFSSPTSKENGPPICPTHRRVVRPQPQDTPPRPTSPVRPSKACCVAWRTLSTPSRRMASRSSGAPDRGGSRSEALRRIAPGIFGRPVLVPPPGEYVADGAAFQAMWVLDPDHKPEPWPLSGSLRFDAEPSPSGTRPLRGGPRRTHLPGTHRREITRDHG